VERDFAGAHITEADYLRLLALCKSDRKMPADYHGWLMLAGEGTRQALNEGRLVPHLVIEVSDFVSWCQRVGIVPCFDALRAYLIVQRGDVEASPDDEKGSGPRPAARGSRRRRGAQAPGQPTATAGARPLRMPIPNGRVACRATADHL
jgi:hypothetical protein